MTPTFRGKGSRGHNLGDNSYLTFCSYHAFTLMSTPYFVRTGHKLGVKKNFCSLHSQNLSPTFKTVAPPLLGQGFMFVRYVSGAWGVLLFSHADRHAGNICISLTVSLIVIVITRKCGNYSDVLPLKAARCDSISNLTSFGASHLSCRRTQYRFI